MKDNVDNKPIGKGIFEANLEGKDKQKKTKAFLFHMKLMEAQLLQGNYMEIAMFALAPAQNLASCSRWQKNTWGVNKVSLYLSLQIGPLLA